MIENEIEEPLNLNSIDLYKCFFQKDAMNYSKTTDSGLFTHKMNHKEQINFKCNLVLKKVLIHMLTVIDIMKLYINQCLQEKLYFDFHMKKETLHNNFKKVEKIYKNRFNQENLEDSIKFTIEKSLKNYLLTDLVEMFSMTNILDYILLTNIYMCGKESTRKVSLYSGKSMSINIKTNEELLFYKSKRKDELVKFSFKFIRKQIINSYKVDISNPKQKIKAQIVKQEFNRNVLLNNRKVINYFYSMEVNKKNLKFLEETPQIIEMINEYRKCLYVKDQINLNIFQKSEKIFKEDITLLDFMKKIFILQNKNNVTLQSILNSLYVFDGFFQF